MIKFYACKEKPTNYRVPVIRRGGKKFDGYVFWCSAVNSVFSFETSEALEHSKSYLGIAKHPRKNPIKWFHRMGLYIHAQSVRDLTVFRRKEALIFSKSDTRLLQLFLKFSQQKKRTSYWQYSCIFLQQITSPSTTNLDYWRGKKKGNSNSFKLQYFYRNVL